jgi:hypothetical protein
MNSRWRWSLALVALALALAALPIDAISAKVRPTAVQRPRAPLLAAGGSTDTTPLRLSRTAMHAEPSAPPPPRPLLAGSPLQAADQSGNEQEVPGGGILTGDFWGIERTSGAWGREVQGWEPGRRAAGRAGSRQLSTG